MLGEETNAGPDSPSSDINLSSVGLPDLKHPFWQRADAHEKAHPPVAASPGGLVMACLISHFGAPLLQNGPFQKCVPSPSQVVVAVRQWEADRAREQAAHKDALAAQLAQMRNASAALEAKRTMTKELTELRSMLEEERRRGTQADVRIARIQRECEAKLADAKAAGNDVRRGDPVAVMELRGRVKELEGQLSASNARWAARAAGAAAAPTDGWAEAEAKSAAFDEAEVLRQARCPAGFLRVFARTFCGP